MLRIPAVVLIYHAFISPSYAVKMWKKIESTFELKLEFSTREIIFSVDIFAIVDIGSHVLNRHSQGGCVQKASFGIAV